uniref:Cytochrome c oxidase subunit 3 n=1 Tax=Pyrops clavatus TaxID=2873973 RepID=A0A9E8G384_9HEMI|nr:cytochrome c oxidase subunit III [Pyrops clavatus]UAT98596.1 cytochrome c oxidase subunit III [Pyrops clavatus]UZT27043.1 cytochrome c oxidase subunit 3 [Pyrops clavatus]
MKKNHPFHMVTKSPWPVLASMNIMTMMVGTTSWMQNKETKLMMMGTILLIMTTGLWWRDVTRESTFQGNHTMKVKSLMKMGMIMFIMSEVMFFISLFWMFFHSSLSPSIEIGMNWPPKSIKTFNPMEVPLLNTIILISSGVTVTWAHQAILANKLKISNKSLMLTVMLGIYFTMLQKWEYNQSQFTISDSIYGSSFFLTTGFHGMHVIIGTVFIAVMMMRCMNLHFSSENHFGLEAAIWYWHFVDVVWLFLYLSIYWWGK